jgi:quinol monooxygenase YgiN
VSEKHPEAAVDLTIVTMRFHGTKSALTSGTLAAVLSRYVVLTRGAQGCRNIDFCVSLAEPSVFVLIQKWDSPATQQGHFDSPAMVEMAKSCDGLLAEAPMIDLLESISAHDLA